MLTQIPLQYFQQFCAEQLGIYSYQNYLEIFIFSFFIYKALRWIQKDYTKPLDLYVYSYCCLLIVSHIFHAQILFWTMIFAMPIIALLCITIHQTTLQKMFILPTSKQLQAHNLPNKEWIDILTRSLLFAAHHQKNIFCIIQRQQSLQSCIIAPYQLNIHIQPNVVDFLLQSSLLENTTLLQVTQFGVIESINGTWSPSIQKRMILHHDHNTMQHNQYAAQLLSQNTDAIIFHIEPTTQQATIWYQDTEIQNASIEQLLSLCKQYLPNITTQYTTNNKGDLHVQKPNGSHSTSSQY